MTFDRFNPPAERMFRRREKNEEPREPMNTKPDFKECLLRANGKNIIVAGRRFRVNCEDTSHKPYGCFSCDVQHMNPKTPDESKFCYWVLWGSESEEFGEILLAVAKAGGWEA